MSKIPKIYLLPTLLALTFACAPMKTRSINPALNSYAQAIEIKRFTHLVFVSGQIPVADNDQEPPADFQEQCKTVWMNIKNQLAACDMKLTDIVKVNTYLSDRKYREENYAVRQQVLGGHSPALTIIIADIYDEAWLLEIEVIAAR